MSPEEIKEIISDSRFMNRTPAEQQVMETLLAENAILQGRALKDEKRVAELEAEIDRLTYVAPCGYCQRQEADNVLLRKALEPFALFGEMLSGVNWVPDGCPVNVDPGGISDLSVRRFREAVAALARIREAKP